MIHYGLELLTCEGISKCSDYVKDDVSCSNNPCNVDEGYGCKVSGSGYCVDMKDWNEFMIG
jgi:hypothetical protein